MLLRLRGESIKYASNAKRKQNNLENILQADIEKLESESDNNPSDNLETKKMELEEIINERMKGQWVPSCSQWNIEGERPKYFCALETKIYLSKTIKRLKKPNGNYLTSQNEILGSISLLYKTLYKANDQNFQDYHLADILGQYPINKLNTTEANALKGALT